MSTKIEWTDETWNPVSGCSKVSPGCSACYAETVARRFDSEWKPWTMPNAAHNVRLHPERLEKPLHWRKPRRVFVNSMSDLFHEQVSDEFIDRVFAVMALTPQHTYQILTKRPERMRAYLAEPNGPPGKHLHARQRVCAHMPPFDERSKTVWSGARWPLPNVWLGVSVEDQRRADERIPELLATPAAVRFVSCEPLLEPVNLRTTVNRPLTPFGVGQSAWPAIDWLIVGGESGPGARPFYIDWARDLRDQCKAAGVPYFLKQVGPHPRTMEFCQPTASRDGSAYVSWSSKDRKGGDMAEFPEDLRVRQFPVGEQG